ncbi:MAG: fumarylacetoacetate hydrolase family protein [Candidatus Hydrothermarchaeales archaeon]
MKLVRYLYQEKTCWGILDGEQIEILKVSPLEKVILTRRRVLLREVRLLAPLSPPNVIAIGLNYKSHAQESGMRYPDRPVVFAKTTNSVIGPGDDIILPSIAPDKVDYEAELAVVMAKKCKNVTRKNALDYVLGYTCGNDITARDCQLKQDTQWTRAKSFDTFCPLGPVIETVLNPDNVAIESRLNGRVMQEGNTRDMIFSCAEVVSYLSQGMTLYPGTVILTGTPSGVGFARKPPIFLRAGDRLEVEIEGIGTLENRVTQLSGKISSQQAANF